MELLHHTLENGVLKQYFWDDLEGKLVTKTTQDLEPSIEYVKAIRNDDEYFSNGVKANMAHGGHIPAWAVVKLQSVGVDVYTAPLKDIKAGLHKLGVENFIWGS